MTLFMCRGRRGRGGGGRGQSGASFMCPGGRRMHCCRLAARGWPKLARWRSTAAAAAAGRCCCSCYCCDAHRICSAKSEHTSDTAFHSQPGGTYPNSERSATLGTQCLRVATLGTQCLRVNKEGRTEVDIDIARDSGYAIGEDRADALGARQMSSRAWPQGEGPVAGSCHT